MTNKEYKTARHEHEYAGELYTYEHYNGWRVSRLMTTEDIRDLRTEYKEDKKNGAYALDGFNGRAVIIPVDGGALLKSYNTIVAAIVNGIFYKCWTGYSATTAKHINAFLRSANLPAVNKREWIEKSTTNEITDRETGVTVYSA